MIGNIVGCSVMLVMGARALWKFHDTGGLHYTKPEKDLLAPLLEGGDDDDEEDIDNAPVTAKDAKKKKSTAAEK